MTQTITKTIYLCAWRFDYMKHDETHWAVSETKFNPATPQLIGQWEHQITLPLPESFTLASQIAAVEAESAEAIEDCRQTVEDCKARIAQLLKMESA